MKIPHGLRYACVSGHGELQLIDDIIPIIENYPKLFCKKRSNTLSGYTGNGKGEE
jgi:hypothetical protein